MICKAFVLVKEITNKKNQVIASNAKANSKRMQSKSYEYESKTAPSCCWQQADERT